LVSSRSHPPFTDLMISTVLSRVWQKDANCGIFFLPDITTIGLRREIVELAARHSVPAMYWDPSLSNLEVWHFTGSTASNCSGSRPDYVDRILRGEKAGDLPFQEPTKYGLSINVRTARALGLTIPQPLLATADEVIE